MPQIKNEIKLLSSSPESKQRKTERKYKIIMVKSILAGKLYLIKIRVIYEWGIDM